MTAEAMPELQDLSALVALVQRERGLYVRWSRSPGQDLTGPASLDALTGVPLPGLSASPLDTEDWWEARSRGTSTTWASRRS